VRDQPVTSTLSSMTRNALCARPSQVMPQHQLMYLTAALEEWLVPAIARYFLRQGHSGTETIPFIPGMGL
jgi:hypothetical protein